MREIKFRGKQLHGNEWIIGDLSHVGDENYTFIYPRIKGKEELNSPDYYQVIPESVGQYTGLKDSEGKEIYEGDIFGISRSTYHYFVTFEDGNYTCYHTKLKNDFDGKNWRWGLLSRAFEISDWPITVIGNIHDNPELLQ